MNAPDPISRLNAALEGRYRVERELGQGGMGTVYLAEQLEPVRRRVALKLLRREFASAQVVARFDAERQALAMMDHPSIAKVFDAGATTDGPFFAMELVDGLPITDYCDGNRLSVRARTRLFVDVCHAVQHAHQKGVIHRDLKPSNVMVSDVDGRPLPKVIDFGIAKAIGASEFDGADVTRDDQVIGTPAYMSPEQIGGPGDVDTRTDVYALGVMLYQLLVGALPYEPEAYRGWVAVAAQLTREPPGPTRRLLELGDTQETVARQRATTPPVLRRQLAGDLEWITRRAMEKAPDDRYETANALALDLQRYSRNEPVRAGAGSRRYVVSKFVRRNRTGVAFGSTVAVGLLAFAIVASVQSQRTARARDDAEARRSQAEGLIDFMLSDLREKLEPIGRLEILDDVGTQATQYFASIPEGRFGDDELASRSQSLYQIGAVRLDQGDAGAATAAFAESLRLARALSDRAPDDGERLFGLSQSHFWVGYAEWLAGDLAAAEEQFLGYLAAAERMIELSPDDPVAREELGFAHGNLGTLREARGDLEGAVAAFEQSLEAKRWLVDHDSSDVGRIGELAETHNKLGVVNRKRGRYEQARDQHDLELGLKRRALTIEPEHAYWRLRYGVALGFLAVTERETGASLRALELRQEQVELLDSLAAFDPSNTDWQRALAKAHGGYAGVLIGLDRLPEAVEHLDRAESLQIPLVASDSTSFGWQEDLAKTRTMQARVALGQGRPEAGLVFSDAALAVIEGDRSGILERVLTVAEAHVVRGRCLAGLGREAEATRAWEAALSATQPFLQAVDRGQLRPVLAELFLVLGRGDQASLEINELEASGFDTTTLRALATSFGMTP
jgi:tetratricopeptide (TPR) repeat protein